MENAPFWRNETYSSGSGRFPQPLGAGVLEHPDDGDRLVVAGEAELSADGDAVAEVLADEGPVDDPDARGFLVVGRQEEAAVEQAHAHHREVVLGHRPQRQADAIDDGRRRGGAADNLELGRPAVAGERYAPREGDVADARDRGDALQRLIVEGPGLVVRPDVGDGRRQDVLGLVARVDPIEVAGGAEEQRRAGQQRHGEHDLHRRRRRPAGGVRPGRPSSAIP